MIETVVQMKRLVEEISERTDEDLDLYMIGGGSMMFLGIKDTTKDLDFVVKDTADYERLIDVLRFLGFVSDRPRPGMEKVNISDTLVRDEYRIDVFDKVICGKLKLSEEMISRSIERIRKGSVSLHTCSPEDIFLLKSLTEREGDYRDGITILKMTSDFRWDVVLEEMDNQMDDESVWVTYTVDRLETINNEGIPIPIMDDVLRLERRYLESWSKKYEDSENQ